MPCPHIPCSVITCFSTQFWNTLCNPQFEDVKQYESNLDKLRAQFLTLKTDRIHVEKLIENARTGENIEDMQDWVRKAKQIEQDKGKWEEKIVKSRGCCHSLRLDWRPRHQLSRDARKMVHDIHVLKTDEKFMKDFSCPAINVPPIEAIPTSDFIPLASSTAAIKEIMDKLKGETKIIGVHGEGGMGKTTLIKQVAKQAAAAKLFDKVVIVMVSKTPNVKIIQDRIAEFLEFKIEKEGEILREASLSERLKQVKKVLIILDNVWQILKLGSLGIPYDKEHEGLKIIITSRSLNVCNGMGAESDVHIKELLEEDAIQLFKMKAGIHDTDACDRGAKDIVDQIGKNPHAILLMAPALRNKPPEHWNAEIQRVRESFDSLPNPFNIKGLSEQVVLCLRLGYDQLKSEEAHKCLLFCCLFPAYYSVSMEELVVYGLVDRLFPDVGTLEDIRNSIQKIIDLLKSSNLLLEGDREGCFRIHDDTRIVVEFFSAEKGYNLVSKAGQRLTECPAEGWESCKRMSLMDSHITKLPNQPKCSQLLILFLRNNALKDIPVDFFKYMKELTYLDMSYTFISELPRSLYSLENLRSLRLENTCIEDASRLSKLSKLEVLILRGSCMKKFPEELERMTNLKILDLSNNLRPQEISSNVISRLSRLEELYIGNSFGEWEVEGTGTQRKASFSEVASLASLTVLHIHVKNKKSLSKDFDGPWGNLRKFNVCVNDDYWDISSARSMHVEELSYPVANWTKLLLEKTEHLALFRSRDLDDIVQKATDGLDALKTLHLRACSIHYIFRSSSFPKVENLEELHVEYCYSLKEVFHLEEIEEEHAKLTRLRELILFELPKMTAIWKGNLSAAHLENLKLMKVKKCGKLANLFPKALAQKVHQLVHLTIMDCENMEEIISSEGEQEATDIATYSNMPPPMCFKNLQKLTISTCEKIKSILALKLVRGLEQLEELVIASCNQLEEIISMGEEREEEEDQNMLPQLKILSLQNLPNLGTLYKGELLLKWHSLDELQVWNCPNLKTLPLDLNGAPELSKFKGQEEWFNNLNWTNEDIKARLQLLLNKED